MILVQDSNGDNMDNIDVRQYIVNNFKDSSIEEIRDSIVESITSKEEDTLIGMGVLFELLWNNSSKEEQDTFLSNIKKGM